MLKMAFKLLVFQRFSLFSLAEPFYDSTILEHSTNIAGSSRDLHGENRT
jgi:hypothetical protein